MSVIVARALPDARDGLKPVHRRILYSMHENGYEWNKPYRKSARVVGDVIGKYHPHGDQAVYDALVRMAQDFSMRLPLIDGQGNFGSVDGDPPAAMRYTEVRLAKVANSLLEDIDKDTEDLNAIIPGPDFPTGGIILGRAGIRAAYLTGRGSIVMRGKAEFETLRGDREAIVITEIPYQVNKATMVERIAELWRDKKIDGI